MQKSKRDSNILHILAAVKCLIAPDLFLLCQLVPNEMVSEGKLEEKWSLKRLSSHSSWGCWLDQYRERLEKEAGNTTLHPHLHSNFDQQYH
jgi:hypothetical protein